jgi:branched-chain amino acid transport system ATP-binding protein
MSEGVLLHAERVSKRFHGFDALSDVSVRFQHGQLTAIIGPNGAGKSTLFNILSGAFPPSEGHIVYDGVDITGQAQHRFAHLGIAKSFQITNVFPQLNAHENVRIAAQVMHSRYQMFRPRRAMTELINEADELIRSVGLWPYAKRQADTLSHGQQRALEIAIALACHPRLLLLDEPTAGMSPEETREMRELIMHLAEERTVVLVEHKMKLVMGISDHIVVLHQGQILAEGAPHDIRANTEVKRVYLGGGERTRAGD